MVFDREDWGHYMENFSHKAKLMLPIYLYSPFILPFMIIMLGGVFIRLSLYFWHISELAMTITAFFGLVCLGWGLFALQFTPLKWKISSQSLLQVKPNGRVYKTISVNWQNVQDLNLTELKIFGTTQSLVIVRTKENDKLVFNLTPMWYKFKRLNKYQVFSLIETTWHNSQPIV